MSKTITEIVDFAAAAVLIVGGVLAIMSGNPAGWYLIAAGAGMVMSGVGTMMMKGPLEGFATASRNPIAPWNIVYGRARVGGTMIFMNSFGDDNKYLDLVIVLAAHPCQEVDAVLFDQKRIPIGTIYSNGPYDPGDEFRYRYATGYGWKTCSIDSGDTDDPWYPNQRFEIVWIKREDLDMGGTPIHQELVTLAANGVFKVPLQPGDEIIVTGTDDVHQFNGKFIITTYSTTDSSISFGQCLIQYLSGGPPVNTPVLHSGNVQSSWPQYREKVYVEVMLGSQRGPTTDPEPENWQTFMGLNGQTKHWDSSYPQNSYGGTPMDGNWNDLQSNDLNPWNTHMPLEGMTAVFLRLHYADDVWGNGLPQISFLVSGKKDIFDPRDGNHKYTDNAALCIADFLHNDTWGFKAAYGTSAGDDGEIPLDPLTAAANLCDEDVTLAKQINNSATEKRYTCNGAFQLNMRRGEILQNLLTCCGGRLTYIGGQFKIWPAAWYGIVASVYDPPSELAGLPSLPEGMRANWTIPGGVYARATGPFRWKSTPQSASIYNGVKGTYINPVNRWMSSDFPRYAQDLDHGYDWGAPPNHDQNLDDDLGQRRWLDIQLPFTISCATAQRLAKIELLRRRQLGTGTFLLNMAGYQFVPMDIISMDLDYFAWEGKLLEVQAARLKFDKQSTGGAEVTLLGVEIDVQETAESVYHWDVEDELSAAGFQQTFGLENKMPPTPTNVKAVSNFGDIWVTWDPAPDAFVIHQGYIYVEYAVDGGAGTHGLWLPAGNARIPGTQTEIVIRNLDIGKRYYIHMRFVSAADTPGFWANADPYPIEVLGGQLYQWCANVAIPAPGDTMFADSFHNFNVAEVHNINADGSVASAIRVTGKLPSNVFNSATITPSFLDPNGQTAVANYTWAIVAGALPTGLDIKPLTGEIFGTVTAGTLAVPFDFTARVTDGGGNIVARNLTIIVNPTGGQTGSTTVDPPGGSLSILTSGLPHAGVGAPYSAFLTAAMGVEAGHFPPGLWWLAVQARSGWPYSQVSFPLVPKDGEFVGPGGGALRLTGIVWPDPVDEIKVFAGQRQNMLTKQLAISYSPPDVAPTDITLVDWFQRSEGIPISGFDHIRIACKLVRHSGIWGWGIKSVSGNTITMDSLGFTAANQFVGRDVSLLGLDNNSADLPVLNYRVRSNTALGVFTVEKADGTDANLDPYKSLITPGSALVMRCKPDTHTATTIGDSLFINDVDYFDPLLKVTNCAGLGGSPIAIVTEHVLDDTVYYDGAEVFVDGIRGATSANGKWKMRRWTEIITSDPDLYAVSIILLNEDGSDTLSNGDYLGGGTVTAVTHGLKVNKEADNQVIIISGTGAWQPPRLIASNTATVLTMKESFDPIPDATSRFIIVEPNWLDGGIMDLPSAVNDDPNADMPPALVSPNITNSMILVHTYTLSKQGLHISNDDLLQMREIYYWGGTPSEKVGLTGYYAITFGVGGGGVDLAVEDDATHYHYVVRFPGFCFNVSAHCADDNWPVGADIILELVVHRYDPATGTNPTEETLLTFKILNGSTSTNVTYFDSPNPQIFENDYLTINVTQVGSTVAGQYVTIELKVTEQDISSDSTTTHDLRHGRVPRRRLPRPLGPTPPITPMPPATPPNLPGLLPPPKPRQPRERRRQGSGGIRYGPPDWVRKQRGIPDDKKS